MSSSDDKTNSFLNSEVINDDFFIEIVERKLSLTRDQFKLRLVFVEPATGKNENFASVVYRARISVVVLGTNEKQFVNVIIKALYSVSKELKEFSVFKREIHMYRDVIESFERIWEERTGSAADFAPKCIKVHSDPYEIMILEDLKTTGYQVGDRKIGFNLEQTKLVLTKLAKFHAASAIRYDKVSATNDKTFIIVYDF
jgi:Ecdysteroid kinase-like family